MADFLADFKRRESSEGSNIDDEEDEPHQFAREEINHQSDEEDNRANQRRNQNNDRSRPYQGEENKDTRDQGQSRNAYPSNQAQNKKKDYYLYQGEEKPYESDPEEEGQGKGTKQKRENLKNKKKDPTYVPKGTFYQHDTRGDETEFVPKKSGGNQGKLKWRHDKFEKGGNKDNGYDKSQKEAGNPAFVNKQKEVVYYVVKGANEQKPAEQEPQEQKPQEQKQQQQQQPQRQQQPREDRPQQQSRGKGYNYDKGGYGNDRNDRNDRDRDYNQNSGKYREYTKKDNYKKSGGNAGGGKQDVYYEYVPKKV